MTQTLTLAMETNARVRKIAEKFSGGSPEQCGKEDVAPSVGLLDQWQNALEAIGRCLKDIQDTANSGIDC